MLEIMDLTAPFSMEALLNHWPAGLFRKQPIHLLEILSVAARLIIVKSWKTSHPLKIVDWYSKLQDICIVDKITDWILGEDKDLFEPKFLMLWSLLFNFPPSKLQFKVFIDD